MAENSAGGGRNVPHRFSTLVVGIPAALFAALYAWDVSRRQGPGVVITPTTDVAAGLSIVVVSAAGLGSLWLFARAFDRTWPTSPRTTAAVRLLIPAIALLFATRIGMMVAVNDRTALGPWFSIVAAGALLAISTTTAGLLAGEVGVGRRHAEVPVDAGVEDSPIEAEGRFIVHRVTSGAIALVWVPIGLLVALLAGFCSPAGMIIAAAFACSQVGGNLAAGFVLDRRFDPGPGTLAAVGRSVLAALVLLTIASILTDTLIDWIASGDVCR